MKRHSVASEQIAEIDAARVAEVDAPDPDREIGMIRLLVAICGMGLETATRLVVRCQSAVPRSARDRGVRRPDRHAVPERGMEREQGISKNGNTRVRCLLLQLTWRWLRFQPDSALSRWFFGGVGEGKGRIRKVMAVALARKLLVALWRYLETGVIPEGVRLADAEAGRARVGSRD